MLQFRTCGTPGSALRGSSQVPVPADRWTGKRTSVYPESHGLVQTSKIKAGILVLDTHWQVCQSVLLLCLCHVLVDKFATWCSSLSDDATEVVPVLFRQYVFVYFWQLLFVWLFQCSWLTDWKDSSLTWPVIWWVESKNSVSCLPA